MAALADLMTAAVIGIALDLQWAVAAAVAADTRLHHTTTTTTAVAHRAAIALVATITADAHHLENFMIDVTQGMGVLHHVVAWEARMSMVHRVPATPKILTMLGSDHLPVATTIPMPMAMVAPTRQDALHRLVALAHAAPEVARHMSLLPNILREDVTNLCSRGLSLKVYEGLD